MDRLTDFSFITDISKANFNMVNEFTITDDKTECNPFSASNHMGNYFQQCSKDQQAALWGSNKPVPDKCDLDPKKDTACQNLWNNQTRRKGVVDYRR